MQRSDRPAVQGRTVAPQGRRCLNTPFAVLCLVLSLALPALAQERLPAEVEFALQTAGIPAGSVGLVVQRVGERRPVLSVNAERAMNPASTMKLVTTFAGLDLLGPNFTWKTQALTTARLNGDVLEGDLILKGGGDPKLTVENLWLLVRALRARGIRHIRGDLVLDHGYFAPLDHDPGRFDGDPTRPYNVGPDALMVNFKAVQLSFLPDPTTGQVLVSSEPHPLQLEIGPGPRLANGPCNDWQNQLRPQFTGNGTPGAKQLEAQGGAQLRLSFGGSYAAECGERTWPVALLSHSQFTYGVFRRLWMEMDGTLTGNWRDGTTSPNARLLYTQESPALAEVVRDINKYSNNVMARQLFLTLSSEQLKTPGSASASAQVVRSWLQQRGIAAPELVLENGSGLSRVERLSAGNMAQLLQSAFASPMMPELLASLPLVAYDGTMKRRLNSSAVAGQAHIKTGTLNDVRAIAGYLLDRSGRRNVIVFFIQHPNAGAGQVAQDALLRWVYAGAPDAAAPGAGARSTETKATPAPPPRANCRPRNKTKRC